MFMKLFQALVVLLCFGQKVEAQQMDSNHVMRGGDKVEWRQVTYKDFQSAGLGCIWDLSDMDTLDKNTVVEYLDGPNSTDQVIGLEHHTCYYYAPESQVVLLNGYENNLTKVVYDMPEIAFCQDMTMGYEKSGVFGGYSIYSENIFSRIYGTYDYRVDGKGSLRLPSGKVVRNVTRVHLSKTISQKYQNNVKSLKALRLLVDSIAPYNADSIVRHLAMDSCLVETNVYRWYAQGYRYPVYETMESHVKGNKSHFTLAKYCSPESQELLNDFENEKIRLALSKEQGEELGERSTELRTSSSFRKQLSDGTICEYTLSIDAMGQVGLDLFCNKKVKASVGIYTVDGMVIGQHELGDLDAHQSCSLSLAANIRGVYVLALTVNGEVFSEKFTY